MNSVAKHFSIFTRPRSAPNSVIPQRIQQWRGIRVKVFDGNLDRALAVMQRKMRESGMERLIKAKQTRHIKNSEKRVLAKKALERRIQSQTLARKLQAILREKVRGL